MQKPIRVYRGPQGEALLKIRVSLPDRPGSLAGFAALIAQAGANITFFHYDRAIDGSRVSAEAELATGEGLDALLALVAHQGYATDSASSEIDEPTVISAEGVLELKVGLDNRPGTLAAFAALIGSHEANVTYMLYDAEIDPQSADIAMAAPTPSEVDSLLDDLNRLSYHYRVLYRGLDEHGEVSRTIGLKLTERFFIRLKKVLGAKDTEDVRALVKSSGALYRDLVGFYEEAGRNLDASEVFEKVLTMASSSRAETGERFRAIWSEAIRLNGVTIEGIRLPTSENIHLLRHGGELALIDAGHGIYYDDLKRALRARGLDPAHIRRIFVTHPDTDHIGMAGRFEAEFETRIFMHRAASAAIENLNRAHGATGRLLALNKYYTRLSVRFTECAFPAHPTYWGSGDEAFGGFRIVDRFMFGPLEFDVMESHGGHAPGLVFYVCRAHALAFTSDFLINPATLIPEDREHLGIYKYLLTNPNSNAQLYKEESAALKSALMEIGEVTVLPGHGGAYKL